MISQITDLFRGVGEWGLVATITELVSGAGASETDSLRVYTPPTHATSAARVLARRSSELNTALTNRAARAEDLKRKDRDVEQATESLARVKRARDEAAKALEEAKTVADAARENQKQADEDFGRAEMAEFHTALGAPGHADPAAPTAATLETPKRPSGGGI